MKAIAGDETCFTHLGRRFMGMLSKSMTSPAHEMMVVLLSDEDAHSMTRAELAAHLASGAKEFADRIRKGYA